MSQLSTTLADLADLPAALRRLEARVTELEAQLSERRPEALLDVDGAAEMLHMTRLRSGRPPTEAPFHVCGSGPGSDSAHPTLSVASRRLFEQRGLFTAEIRQRYP